MTPSDSRSDTTSATPVSSSELLSAAHGLTCQTRPASSPGRLASSAARSWANTARLSGESGAVPSSGEPRPVPRSDPFALAVRGVELDLAERERPGSGAEAQRVAIVFRIAVGRSARDRPQPVLPGQ